MKPVGQKFNDVKLSFQTGFETACLSEELNLGNGQVPEYGLDGIDREKLFIIANIN